MQAGTVSCELTVFNDIAAFSRAVEDARFALDFASVTRLNTSFMKSSEKYLVLNVKDFDEEDSNNLLFLSEERAYLYAKKPPPQESFDLFKSVYNRPYGKCTVLTFLVLNKALASCKAKLESMIEDVKELEQNFDAKKYHDLIFEFEKLYDRLEDFYDLVLRLEERSYKEVETRLISFDYSVLIAESGGLVERSRRRYAMLKDVARENETQAIVELTRRTEKLNDIVKRLTALTVALMIPNVIAGHFGMNFQFMPELQIPWAYPLVIIIQVAITAIALLVFRRIKWL